MLTSPRWQRRVADTVNEPHGTATRRWSTPATVGAVVMMVLAALLATPGQALAAPEIHQSGPAGTVDITLRPSTFPGRLALDYDLVDTQGATGGSITLTPVGLNAKPSTTTFGGPRAHALVLFPYPDPGAQVSVGVHVIFLTPEEVQDNSTDPFIVSWPQ